MEETLKSVRVYQQKGTVLATVLECHLDQVIFFSGKGKLGAASCLRCRNGRVLPWT